MSNECVSTPKNRTVWNWSFLLKFKTVNMKKTRFTETQIVSILKQQEAGRSTKEICREHSISEATFYNWKSKYGGMEASDVKRMKDLEEENARLKRMYANLAMDNEILRDLFTKKGWALPQKSS